MAHHWSSAQRVAVLDAMLATMVHRGPDEVRRLDLRGMAIGATRLGILDLSHGSQPMVSPDGSVAVAQNGEIYNYPQLRDELSSNGHTFQTHCDTEVLLHGYLAWGWTNLLAKLRGMFALTVADARTGALYVARDRLGIKPLYLAQTSEAWLFASEVRALMASGVISPQLSPQAVARHLLWNYTPGEQTLVAQVTRLLPGHQWRVGEGQPKPWWRLAELPLASSRLSDDQAVAQLCEVLTSSVREHLAAEVPIGAFLSGGVDSSVVVALAQRELDRPLQTLSVAVLGEGNLDESAQAERVAQAVGTEHTRLSFSADDCLAVLDEALDAADEPLGDSASLPTYLMCREARRGAIVVLSGEGGDEVFGGYDYYQPRRRTAAQLARDLLGPIKRRFTGVLGPAERDPVSGFTYTAERRLIRRLTTTGDGGGWPRTLKAPSSLLRRQLADLTGWLPDDLLMKVDKMSMAHSLEARVPYLDHRVVTLALGLPDHQRVRDGVDKWVLRELAARLLPTDIAHRPKQGFVLPLAKWLRGPLLQPCQTAFADPALTERTGLVGSQLLDLLHLHCSGQVDLCRLLWSAYTLADWAYRRLAAV